MDVADANAVSGDTLGVVLFLLGTAVNFFVPTLKPEERHVRILFRVIAGLLTLMAITWPFLRAFFPALVAPVISLTSSAWAWFILLMVTLVVNSLPPGMGWWKASQRVSHSPVAAGPPLLKPNQVLYPYPSKNSMLWEWDHKDGMLGPFCPTHGNKLRYWSTSYNLKKAEFKEEDSLNGSGSFVCLLDDEEFIFIRPIVYRIRDIRDEATARYRAEVEHARKNVANK
jgi:hypothetical protein